MTRSLGSRPQDAQCRLLEGAGAPTGPGGGLLHAYRQRAPCPAPSLPPRFSLAQERSHQDLNAIQGRPQPACVRLGGLGVGVRCGIWAPAAPSRFPSLPGLGPKSQLPRNHACVPRAVPTGCSSVSHAPWAQWERNGPSVGQGTATESQCGVGPAGLRPRGSDCRLATHFLTVASERAPPRGDQPEDTAP